MKLGVFGQWVSGNGALLNLIISLSAAIIGLVLYLYLWRWKRAAWSQHSFMHWAFWFFFLRWLALVGVYTCALVSPTHQARLLAFVDFQNVCDMGFAWIFIQGDEYSWKSTCGALFGMCVLLLGWNWFFHGHMNTALGNTSARLNWMMLSDAASAFATPLVGFAFLLRYRRYAFALFLFSLAYSAFQGPIYFATLLKSTDISQGLSSVSGYLLGLVLGKVIVAGMAYDLFFAPVSSYSISFTDLADETKHAIRQGMWKWLKWVLSVLLIDLILALLAPIILRYVGILH